MPGTHTNDIPGWGLGPSQRIELLLDAAMTKILALEGEDYDEGYLDGLVISARIVLCSTEEEIRRASVARIKAAQKPKAKKRRTST